MESLTDKLYKYSDSDYYPFHMPGHKRQSLGVERGDLIARVRNIDITEIDGFDNLHDPTGILKALKDEISTLWGSDESYILVNGSTCGILAAICSQTDKGSRIIFARNSHKSAYNALVLGELRPVFVYPEMIPEINICGAVRPSDIEREVKNHPDAEIVYLTSPTYEGVISDISAISAICHENGRILIVDEAHGAHLGFDEKLADTYGMKSALSSGADIVIQSLHKTLPSFTQTAVLHMRSGLVNEESLRRYISIFQSTSPSYVLMAGVQRCTDIIESQREILFSAYRNKLYEFYKMAEGLKSLKLLKPEHLKGTSAAGFDIGKLVAICKNAPFNGRDLYKILIDRYHIQPEMYSGNYIIAMTSVMDVQEGFDRLINALLEIDGECETVAPRDEVDKDIKYPVMEQKYSISEAEKRAGKGTVNRPIDKACGCVSADFVYAYPPGIPVIIPGEVISMAASGSIDCMLRNNIEVHGLAGLKDIRVIDE